MTYSVLKVPLNPNQPTNPAKPGVNQEKCASYKIELVIYLSAGRL